MPHLQTGFHPKAFSAWREGLISSSLKADALAGLTVAIVALPLSMAIAIASHVPPERGLYSAIVGGFIISALGGTRYQVGGPAGAFIVLVATIVDTHGLAGLLTAMIMAGAMLFAVGASGLGVLIRYVPRPVVQGFSAGIAVIIFSSQIRDLLGLQLAGAEPAAILPKLQALWAARASFNPVAFGVGAAAIALIQYLRARRPMWPSLLIVAVLGALVASALPGAMETINSKFGGLPSTLPRPQLPDLSAATALSLLPAAASIALLGGIESLLSALVADSMTERRHRTSTELMAQGLANIATALFGGIVATGLIARTATNIRAGAKTPMAGMLHSVFVLLFILVAGPLAGYVPLAALAGILATVCWNMADKIQIRAILMQARTEALILVVTFVLTVFVDLTTGILAGTALAFVTGPRRFLKAKDEPAH